MPVEKVRCTWATGSSALMIAYHDTEWGTPVRDDDRTLFEFITLEGAQAGLSWDTVLNKRVHYNAVFENFEIARVAKFGDDDVERLMLDPGIIRNRLKITSAIDNAKAALALQREFGSLSNYFWNFVGGKPIVHRPASLSELPVTIPLAEAISKDLKKRGFRFVGPTIVYSFLQATGMVDDHMATCFRASKKARSRGSVPKN